MDVSFDFPGDQSFTIREMRKLYSLAQSYDNLAGLEEAVSQHQSLEAGIDTLYVIGTKNSGQGSAPSFYLAEAVKYSCSPPKAFVAIAEIHFEE